MISSQETGDRRQLCSPHHPTPHTLHPTPHSPHPTPHSPHPTPHSPITPHPQNSLIFPTFGLFTP
ncbi:hypothetical protein [Microcystis aeruginosa]|uniref:hypothetical protein n=1 Tax=Microcystis aeruginosa TaxID=1126 RepID=UPI0009D6F78D|nr:hypothetical protein [Microcystis aeruginosa]